MAFGAQTDKIFIAKSQFWEKFHGIFVVDDLSVSQPAVTFALLAFIPVAPQDRGPLLEPRGAVIVKLFHSKTKRAHEHSDCYTRGLWASIGAIFSSNPLPHRKHITGSAETRVPATVLNRSF